MRNLFFAFLISVFVLAACAGSRDMTDYWLERNSSYDGHSFEQALIVESIPEEYQYVEDRCDDCQVVSQSLLYHEGKPYDILTAVNEGGEVYHYYFDISRFFGKRRKY